MPTIRVPLGRRPFANREYKAGISLRLVRSPDAPKITRVFAIRRLSLVNAHLSLAGVTGELIDEIELRRKKRLKPHGGKPTIDVQIFTGDEGAGAAGEEQDGGGD